MRESHSLLVIPHNRTTLPFAVATYKFLEWVHSHKVSFNLLPLWLTEIFGPKKGYIIDITKEKQPTYITTDHVQYWQNSKFSTSLIIVTVFAEYFNMTAS